MRFFVDAIFDGAAVLLFCSRIRGEGRAAVPTVIKEKQTASGSDLDGVLLAGPSQPLRGAEELFTVRSRPITVFAEDPSERRVIEFDLYDCALVIERDDG